MMKRFSFIAFAAAVLLLLGAGDAFAQFDTPNRAFHNQTSFVLEGQHQAVACESCHINGQYRGTPNTCFDCHWVRRQDDRYQTRLGTQCQQCHRPTSWTAVRWDHSTQSGVALNSHHRTLACESCHRNANFQTGSVTCANCHERNFLATTSPNHVAAGFPPVCDACHKPSDMTWQNSGATGAFNHNSYYPLVGVHATQACAACHKNNVYAGTPRDCVGCHRNDYNSTQNPNHVAAGFPLSCDGCHRATDPSFRGSGALAAFNHSLVFALVGVHATQTCVTCHKNNVYTGTPRVCVGCHQENYNRTTNPNHVSAGFSTTCDTCHKPTDPTWGSGAGFNHNSLYPLVGLHATLVCTACHVNNVYPGTPTTCIGCHQAQYNATKNPNHVAAGFATTCDSCHKATDATWLLATFNHTAFPLTGNHNVTCTQCHITPNNFATFSCTICHGRSQTDSTHQGRNGYVYDSNACYSCHPRG